MTGWTEDRVATLKKYWDDGLSGSQIANRLGGLTRNAVIGKVHRLKLARRLPSPRVRRQTKDTLYTKPRDGISSFYVTRGHVRRRPKAKTPRRHEPAPRSRLLEQVLARLTVSPGIPEPLRIELLDLREQHCRWPLDGCFCGLPKARGLSWCDHHAAMGLQFGRRKR